MHLLDLAVWAAAIVALMIFASCLWDYYFRDWK